eukprot:3312717-Pyramimonas_sp.AAC.1
MAIRGSVWVFSWAYGGSETTQNRVIPMVHCMILVRAFLEVSWGALGALLWSCLRLLGAPPGSLRVTQDPNGDSTGYQEGR